MSERSDWAACQTLWLLRRGRPEPKTWPVSRLVRERVGEELTGKAPTRAEPPVRWTREVKDGRSVGILRATLAQAIRDKWDELGHHPTGYHEREYRAYETVGDENPVLTWWLLDIGIRPGWAVWLECADIASHREGVTHLGVITCRLRAWPHDPEVSLEQRPAAAIIDLLGEQRLRMEVAALKKADRTPGLHCARCPDRQCPVRAS